VIDRTVVLSQILRCFVNQAPGSHRPLISDLLTVSQVRMVK